VLKGNLVNSQGVFMSRSHYSFLAILPLFSILTMSPMQIESNFPSRSIASEVVSSTPKYEARAAKIDRSKIEIDADLDLDCFSERGEAFRERLLEERKDYKVDVVDKDAVAAQRARLTGLVSGLVDLEVDMAALKEKKAWDPTGEEIANNTMNELKVTLESLLQDEIENELAVLKDSMKPEVEVAVTPEVIVKEEEPKKEEPVICEAEERNKVLTKQVEDLLAEQKKIMETMLGMSNMMIQMNQNMQMAQQQQQYTIPSWLMSGSLVNPQLQYPYMGSPTIIMMVGNSQAPQSFFGGQGQQPQMGQQSYDQNMQSGQYQMPQQQGGYYNQSPYMNDPRYSMPSPMIPGSFGNDPFQYNFGPGPSNQLPIQTA
jgi:hypothetical protein